MISERQLFLDYVGQTSSNPISLEIQNAEGVYLYTKDGKKYLDLISGIAVNNLGHRHPAIVQAIKAQADLFLHTMVYGEHVQGPQVQLAKLLSENLPGTLNNTYFVNSGSEAIEGAMKLVKRFTGRTEIVACKSAYHGSTHGALSLMGDEHFKNAFRPLIPDIRFIGFNEFEDLRNITEKTAACFIEPIQGEAGIFIPDPGYLEAMRKRCSETGTLLVFDEVQTGFGRTGSLFAFQEFGVIPDVLVLAKGLGGGMPLGAFTSSKEIMSVLQVDPVLGHITTFGGHPVSAAAGLASLKALLQGDILQSIPEKEELIRNKLRHQAIKALRGKGLLFAADLEDAERMQKLMHKALDLGVFTDWFLFRPFAFRIAPPLIISMDELESACDILLECLDKL